MVLTFKYLQVYSAFVQYLYIHVVPFTILWTMRYPTFCACNTLHGVSPISGPYPRSFLGYTRNFTPPSSLAFREVDDNLGPVTILMSDSCPAYSQPLLISIDAFSTQLSY